MAWAVVLDIIFCFVLVSLHLVFTAVPSLANTALVIDDFCSNIRSTISNVMPTGLAQYKIRGNIISAALHFALMGEVRRICYEKKNCRFLFLSLRFAHTLSNSCSDNSICVM